MKFAKEKVNPKGNDLNLKEENPSKTQREWHFLTMKIKNWELFGFTRDLGSEKNINHVKIMKKLTLFHKSRENIDENDSNPQSKLEFL